MVFIVIVYFLYPETANRTLEDLDAYFDRDSGHPTIIRVGDKEAKQTARPIATIEAEARRIEASDGIKKMGPTATHVEDVDQVWIVLVMAGKEYWCGPKYVVLFESLYLFSWYYCPLYFT